MSQQSSSPTAYSMNTHCNCRHSQLALTITLWLTALRWSITHWYADSYCLLTTAHVQHTKSLNHTPILHRPIISTARVESSNASLLSCLTYTDYSYWHYTDYWIQWVSELYYDRRSVGQSILVSSTHLGLTTRFLLLSANCGFVDVGRPLWREVESVLYYVQCKIH
jgi:hypothetical protein